MNGAQTRKAVLFLLTLAIALRLAIFATRPELHQDESFQYIEPAWWHIHGFGWPAWEWGVGLRSWVLPAYHGAWIELLGWLGLGASAHVYDFLQVHWAVASSFIVPAAWEAGRLMSGSGPPGSVGRARGEGGWLGGLLAAGACAVSPVLVWYGPHVLSEVPSMILFVWGYALWLGVRTATPDLSRQAALTGAVLSMAVAVRIANLPLAVVPVIDLVARKKWRLLACAALGALGPFAIFALVDWITWGSPFHSTIAYLDFNLHSAGVRFGTLPATEYLVEIRDVLGWAGLIALVVPIGMAARSVWPCALGALVLLGVLSLQAHKEPRFFLAGWALFFVAWGAALARLASERPASKRWDAPKWLALVCGAILIVQTTVGLSRLPPFNYRVSRDLVIAEAWVGEQRDVRGVLLGAGFGTGGGWSALGRNVPLESFSPQLLEDPLFNYLIVRKASREYDVCRARGGQEVWSAGDFIVWRRS